MTVKFSFHNVTMYDNYCNYLILILHFQVLEIFKYSILPKVLLYDKNWFKKIGIENFTLYSNDN